VVNKIPSHPLIFLEVRILNDIKSSNFGSADSKGVTGPILGCAGSKRVRGWRLEIRGWTEKNTVGLVTGGGMGERRGVGIPPRCEREKYCNGIERKEIDGFSHGNATGLQRKDNGRATTPWRGGEGRNKEVSFTTEITEITEHTERMQGSNGAGRQ
jgi:hypothetical protein